MKVYLEPTFKRPDSGEGGIRRVVDAQRRYLPEFGVELVDDINVADLTAGHGGARPIKPGVPFISHSHGLYWKDYQWTNHEDNVNPVVIEALLAADAITVPSQWVRGAYVRGILRDPKVVYHGVEASEWTPAQEPGNYVLWNKPRHDAVSNVNEMLELAKQMPQTQFVATLGNPNWKNVRLTGRLPYQEMKAVIEGAGVYLATARETFGIGTLEALAAGVPVAGWRHGGQREIITEGETGYLADYGDYAALAAAVGKCFSERARLSANAREDVRKRWGWLDKIEQYAALYSCVLHERTAERPKVSVIVTCHELGKYLSQCLGSVLAQTFVDWECLVVDDDSHDNTESVTRYFVSDNPKFKYLKTPENLKLSRARNWGFERARGRYVINLDADDRLMPDALQLLTDALDRNPHLHIAYGSLDILSEDGKTRNKNPFPGQFNWLGQMAHLNQSHYSAMMRREVWEQVGGYRERMWRAEDAEFWCRATSFGFRAAKVTEQVTLCWRFRPDGKSATERKTYPDIDGDWTADFPWSIAHSGAEGMQAQKNGFRIARWDTVPFGAPVKEAPIWHREHPVVSVIIPLGSGHERYVIDALDSLVAQTFHQWEAVVVDDTGTNLQSIAGAPYARIIHTAGRVGPGAARNLGMDQARAPLVLFLDADDILASTALAQMVDAYAKSNTGYVYTGWRVLRPDRQVVDFEAQAYDPHAWFVGAPHGRHTVTVLMATEDARRIRFDEAMIGYEDWDYFCKAAVLGVCGTPVNAQLLTYRWIAGQRSVKAGEHREELSNEIRARYAEYAEGRKQVGQCCGGNKKALEAIMAARAGRPAEPSMSAALAAPVPAGHVRMQFMGDRKGPVTYHANGHPYTGANTEDWKYVDALEADVARLEAMGVWKRVRIPAPQPIPQGVAPAPQPIPQPVTPMPVPAPAPLAQPPEYPKGGVAAMLGQTAKLTITDINGNSYSREVPIVETTPAEAKPEPEPAPAPVAPKRKRTRKAKAEAVTA